MPEVAQAEAWTLQQLRENVEFGTGEISINTATASELKRAGLTSRQAASIVAFREEHGSFESIEETELYGIGPKTLAKLYEIVGDDEAWAAFQRASLVAKPPPVLPSPTATPFASPQKAQAGQPTMAMALPTTAMIW